MSEKDDKLEQIRRCAREGRVVFAGTEILSEYPEEVQMVKDAIRRAAGIRGMLITDDTTLGDFPLDREQIVAMCFELGVTISSSDYIWQVAKRLKEAGRKPRKSWWQWLCGGLKT